ncbi:hypothetical protein FACS1894109_12800 [Spirochaetia bacterium]|nr:hypothetical protein FACS1894109_12800 [Spirochaetia bacterium]
MQNNIYGVDIDSQAVEVTKLSLYLKLLENEGTQAGGQLEFDMALLPSLENNIKCGNSLIGTDFYTATLDFDDEAARKVNCFDWEKEFPEVFKNLTTNGTNNTNKNKSIREVSVVRGEFSSGGFDAVIGNPPYGAGLLDSEREYLGRKFNLSTPIADTFLMFFKKAFLLSSKASIISYIIPSPWLYMSQYKDFRKDIISQKIIKEIQLFRKPVFGQATVETCIFVSENTSPNKDSIYSFKEIKNEPNLFVGDFESCVQQELLKNEECSLVLSNQSEQQLFQKIKQNKPLFKDIALIVCGLTPYRVGKGKPAQTEKIAKGRLFDAEFKKDKTYRQYLMGRDFYKYAWTIEKERWISYGDWLAEPRYKAPFNDEKKIIIRQTSDKLIAHIDTHKYLSLKNVHNVRIINEHYSYEFVLALLNSKVLDWWYQKLIPEKGRVFAEVKVVNLEKLPVPTLDPSKPADKTAHDKLVSLVDKMLELKRKEHDEPNPQIKTVIGRQIGAVDGQIDKLVFELYKLTEDEIKVVEGENE